MPRGFPEDTNKQRFLVEVIEKENTSRLRAWHVANTSQVGNTNSDSKSKQFQVINFTYRAAYTLRAVLVALTVPTFCFSSPPGTEAMFRDEHVSSVSICEHISGISRPMSMKNFVHVADGRGSVLL